MRDLGVAVETLRAVDVDLPPGVYPDMTEHGWPRDDWPQLYDRVLAADVLVVATPIWLGEKSSVCTRLIERLYGTSSLLNEHGSTPTTAASAAVSSPATRTASSTAR